MTNLIQMLKECDIKNVLSVDDGWKINEKFSEKIQAQGIDEEISLKDYCKKYEISIEELERDIFLEFEEEPLKSIDIIKEKMPVLYSEICRNMDYQVDSSLQTLESILNELTKCNLFNICKSEKFLNSHKKLVGNTLYILDKDMGEDKKDEFLEYILEISNSRYTYRDLVIVYSNEVSGLLTHDQKVEYIKSNNVKNQEIDILYQFWPVSKITDVNELLRHIEEMVSKSIYGKALSKMVDIKQNSIKAAFDDLLKINIDNLDNMIIESYFEGGKITESYDLLIESLINRNLLKQINETNILDYEKALIKYEVKRSREILDSKNINSHKKYDIFRKETKKEKLINAITETTLPYGISDYTINMKYCNPAMGDIYKFVDPKTNKSCVGMLISQECSTMIRKEKFVQPAKRKAIEFLLLLFELIEITQENCDNISVNLDDFIWPIIISEKAYILESIKKSMYIDSDLLDLCGLNKDGKAVIDFSDDAVSNKGVLSQEYYLDFKERFNKKIEDIVEEIIAFDITNTSEKEKCENLIKSLAFGIKYDEGFSLQRICKLDEKQTLHIIHEYLNGIGKIGLPIQPSV